MSRSVRISSHCGRQWELRRAAGKHRHDHGDRDACGDEVAAGEVPAGCRHEPGPNKAIKAADDTRLVTPIASPVVAAATPSPSSVLTFSKVPVAGPNGVR
jgi:hypothetical protein